MKAIEIVVAPTGEIQIEASGFKGLDCEKATRFLEEALGLKTKRVKKPVQQQSLQQKAGL